MEIQKLEYEGGVRDHLPTLYQTDYPILYDYFNIQELVGYRNSGLYRGTEVVINTITKKILLTYEWEIGFTFHDHHS